MRDIGAPVRDLDGQDFSSAMREPNSNRVRFLSRDGLCAVYDSRWDQWSTFTTRGVGSAVWDDRYVFVDSDGHCFVEATGSSYRDGTQPYRMLIETGWVSFQGLQDYGRVRSLHILGDYYSPHILHTDIAYNYRNEYVERREVDTRTALETDGYGDLGYGSGSYGGGPDDVYQFQINLRNQRASSVRFRFYDEIDQDGGASFELTELAVKVAMKPGQTRVPGRKRKTT